jgi:hypothetical protein
MNLLQALPGSVRAVLLLLLTALLVWFGAVTPYLEGLQHSSRAINAAKDQLALYRNAASRGTRETDSSAEKRLAHYLLPGASSSAAAAYLQERAGAVAHSSGAVLLSFELLPPPPASDVRLETVTGRIRMTGNTQSLRAWLHALESQRPLLQLNNVFVRARSPSDSVPGGHLDVQIDLSGFRQPGNGSTP